MVSRLCILVLLVLAGVYLTCDAITIVYFPTVCQPQVVAKCSSANASIKVCYDHKIYDNWCDFTRSGCNGTARDNVTAAYINLQCGVSVFIRPPVPTTTQPPLTEFEDQLFNDAIFGIDDLLQKANQSGATVDQMKKIFSTQNHNSKHYVRNTKCWAYNLDLTPISPWNSRGKTRRAGVLVSPRHAIWARHYNMGVNTTIRFVDKHNHVVDRKIARIHSVPSSGSQYLRGHDIVVGELDSDVPSTISFVKILPKNISTIRPPAGLSIPVFDTDFEEKALVADLGIESGTMVSLRVPREPLRAVFYEKKITGDSGNPAFLVLNDQLVLMFVFTYGGAGSGSSVSYHENDINNIMKSWGSKYRLTEVDLTSYLHGNSIPQIIG